MAAAFRTELVQAKGVHADVCIMEYDNMGRVPTSNKLPTERHQGRPDDEIQMRRVLVSGLCGTKPEFTPGQDLALAHRMVSGLESLPEGVG